MFVATVALGLFSLERMNMVQTSTADLRDNWAPNASLLGEMKFVSMRYRQRQAVYLMWTTEAQQEKERANLAKLKAQFEGLCQRFSASVDSDEERTMFQEVRDDWNAYLAVEPEMFAVLKQQGAAAANTYYAAGTAKHTYDKLQTVLEKYAAYYGAGTAQAGATGQAVFEAAQVWIMVAIAFGALLSIAMGYILIRSVSTPLTAMTGAMGELARGHLDAHVPHADQQDEIGKLAEAMTSFKNQLAAAERSKQEQTQVIVESIGTGLDQLAKGILTYRVTNELSGPFAKLKDDFNSAIAGLQETVRRIMGSTHQIANGSAEVSQAADDLSRRTEQQAASLEQTAATLEEITTSVKRSAAGAQDSSRAMAQTKAVAEEGGRVVATAVQAMDAIAQSSHKITDIIGVIDEIAFQTNLLALNAGVEAARAGDAGRGFAVVASEVRALAQRSSEAAKEIKALIKASSEQVGCGVKLVDETGAVLQRIVAGVTAVTTQASEDAKTGEQTALGIEQINSAVSQMDQVTQQNAAMVEQSTAASRNLAHEAKNMAELMSAFSIGESAAVVVPTARSANSTPPSRPAKVTRSRTAAALKPAPKSDDWEEF